MKMDIIVGLFVGLVILWFYSLKRKALLGFEYQYKLNALKEDLRRLEFDDTADPDTWVFFYLKNSITITSLNLFFLNFYTVYGFRVLYAKNKSLASFNAKLTAELNQPKNVGLKKINYEFGNLIAEYIIKKHGFLGRIFLKIHTTLVHRNNRNRRNPPSQMIAKIKQLRFYPEMSASQIFF